MIVVTAKLPNGNLVRQEYPDSMTEENALELHMFEVGWNHIDLKVRDWYGYVTDPANYKVKRVDEGA